MEYEEESLKNLVNQVDEGYNNLLLVICEVPQEDDKLIVGDYNLKDIIAHIALWEQFCIDSLEGIKNKTIKVGKPNIKKINLGFYEKFKNVPMKKVKNFAEEIHKRLINYLGTVDYKILSKPEPYYPDKNDIYTMITHCTTRHYPWAIKHIRKYLKGRRL